MPRRFDPAVPELMDRPQSVSAELRQDLANLRQLNRFFGAYSLVQHITAEWLASGRVQTILDIATGSGDIPRLLVRNARRLGRTVAVTALDQQEATLAIARELNSDENEISFVRADAFAWSPSDAFDLVICNLALHHFSDDKAVELLRRLQQWSRRYVVVTDLRRGWFLSFGVRCLTTFLFRNRMTRVDARLSAERAFSFREMGRLAERAGWRNYHHGRFRFGRQAISLNKG